MKSDTTWQPCDTSAQLCYCRRQELMVLSSQVDLPCLLRCMYFLLIRTCQCIKLLSSHLVTEFAQLLLFLVFSFVEFAFGYRFCPSFFIISVLRTILTRLTGLVLSCTPVRLLVKGVLATRKSQLGFNFPHQICERSNMQFCSSCSFWKQQTLVKWIHLQP